MRRAVQSVLELEVLVGESMKECRKEKDAINERMKALLADENCVRAG